MDWTDGWYDASTSAMRQTLGIDQSKVNCRSLSIRTTPAACVSWIIANALSGVSAYVPYVPNALGTFYVNARLFSVATLGTAIPEVDVDDFFAVYQTWYNSAGSGAQATLSQSIDAFKSVNHALKFGITVYETDLDPAANPLIDDAHMPPYLRAKVDVIRLFLHYRANGPKFADYVAQAQAAFPQAEIVAGVYSYDRIDFYPCAQGSSARCTQAQEVGYFQQALNIQVQLLKQGTIVALDCFPGWFGNEANIYASGINGDDLPCNDAARCLQTTLSMRAALASARAAFGAATPAAGGTPPQIATPPTNTSLSPGQTQIFSVSVSGAAPFTYQWYRSGVAISGATSPSYHTPPVTASDNRSTYACRVGNAYGSVLSPAGVMTVSGL